MITEQYQMPKLASTILKKKKILVFLPPKNFREDEFVPLVDALKKYGCKVTLASTLNSIMSYEGNVFPVDMLLGSINQDSFDVLIILDEWGVEEYNMRNNTILQKLIFDANAKHKIIGAISQATKILAKSNILKDRGVTVFRDPYNLDLLHKAGAVYFREPVVRDANILTADGPVAIRRFIESLVDMMTSQSTY